MRFTLTVLMRADLQQHCKVTYHVTEHTGHVGPDALACHQRQRFLSAAVVERVAQGLCSQLPIAKILTENLKRIEGAWLSDPSNAASGLVRRCPCGHPVSITSARRIALHLIEGVCALAGLLSVAESTSGEPGAP